MIETENAQERGSGVAAMDEKKTGMGLLREAARLLCAVPGNAGCGVAYALGNGCGDHESCSECVGASLATIADRIEREREELDKRLMPEGMEWPRFEDGELVCFGDRFELPSGSVGNVAKITLRKCEPAILHDGIGRNTVEAKRPKPAVIAADGLPIEAGQTVYFLENGKEYTVLKCIADDDGYYVDLSGKPFAALLRPSMLTHTPPDTQERIAEDEKKQTYDYRNCRDVQCRECPSKINGEDPSERYGVDSCEDAKTIDLYERRRKLDKRMMGGAE